MDPLESVIVTAWPAVSDCDPPVEKRADLVEVDDTEASKRTDRRVVGDQIPGDAGIDSNGGRKPRVDRKVDGLACRLVGNEVVCCARRVGIEA